MLQLYEGFDRINQTPDFGAIQLGIVDTINRHMDLFVDVN